LRRLPGAAVLLLSALIALPLLAAACGGGEGKPLTLEQFFADAERLDNELSAKSAELDDDIAFLNETNGLQQAPILVEQLTDAIDEFVEGLADLNAPDEAVAVQDEAVRAGREIVVRYRALLDEAERAGSYEEVRVIFADPDLVAAFQDLDEACAAATELAAANNIGVELECA
jgi:hypothetical protein